MGKHNVMIFPEEKDQKHFIVEYQYRVGKEVYDGEFETQGTMSFMKACCDILRLKDGWFNFKYIIVEGETLNTPIPLIFK